MASDKSKYLQYADMWLRLKLENLPCIAQEVENIEKKYQQLVDQVRNNDQAALQKLISLQTKIRARIEEFDKFYDKNYSDYRIGYFQTLKLKLRKLLSPQVDVNRQIYEQKYSQIQKQSPTKKKNSPSPSPPHHHTLSGNLQQSHIIQVSNDNVTPKSSLVQKIASPKASVSPVHNKNNVKSNYKITNKPTIQTKTPVSTTNKAAPAPAVQNKLKSPMNQARPQTTKQTGKTNASETMFTIKMTKEEYMEYMQQQQSKKN